MGAHRRGPWARLAILLLTAAVLVPRQAGAETLTLACSAVGVELEMCRTGADAWAAETGHSVEIVSVPNGANDRLALYQQILGAGSDAIDVLQIDVIWPGILGDHFVDLMPHLDAATRASHLPAALANNTVDGRLVALPWFIDVGLLYYRSDLLDTYGRPVPATWAELAETATLIQAGERDAGNDRFWGVVFQGRAYEGLTCNALEWVASHGGRFVGTDGAITAAEAPVVTALSTVSGWVGAIAPPGVLNYDEEGARAVFQAGDAAFMRNWPYAWPLANAAGSLIAGRVGVAPLPRGGDGGAPAATLGGQQLAVSRYSAHPDLAVDLVRHLTDLEEQRRRAIEAGFNPTHAALYDDPDVVAATPFIGTLRGIVDGAVARPAAVAGDRYGEASAAIWNAVHGVLSGATTAEDAAADLQRSLQRLSRGGRW